MHSDPIFIIGTERSGSNLLRLMLNAHSRIAIPHPPHVMRDMAPFAKTYGNLREDGRFEAMAKDMARLVNSHFAPWPFKIEARKLTASAPVRSLYGLYVALYEEYLRHQSKARWGCKSTFMFKHIEEIRRVHEKPRFLHLVRDPRDVAASADQSIFSQYHPYLQAKLWKEEQARIEYLRGADVLRVRYEDLVHSPEKELRRIMEFLGESFEPSQLDFFRGREAQSLSSMSASWKNCSAPVSAKSVGRYRERLLAREIALVEFEAGGLMQKYGYRLETNSARRPTRVELMKIKVNGRLRMVSTESKALFSDRNFSLRWKKWFLLQYLNWMRSFDHGWKFREDQNV
jgi:hypothetical protein